MHSYVDITTLCTHMHEYVCIHMSFRCGHDNLSNVLPFRKQIFLYLYLNKHTNYATLPFLINSSVHMKN